MPDDRHRDPNITQWSLAIETSCALGSVALGRGSELIAEQVFSANARHAVELLPTVDKLLKINDLRPDDIRWIFVSAGPGSFTGLRVGFTFARALAQTCGARCLTVPTCDVIAENLIDLARDQTAELYIAIVLDAKREQIYSAAFRWAGEKLDKVLTERVIYPRHLISQLPRPLWLSGEGIDYHRPALEGDDVAITDKTHWRPKASNVLKLGWQLAQQGLHVDYNHLTPTYIRLPEAEERWRAGLLRPAR